MLCRQFHSYRFLTGLLWQPAKCAFRKFSTVAANEDESELFRAVLLHPKKQTLVIEKFVDRTKLEDGKVRIGVEFCSVTNADVHCMTELTNVTLPYTPGSDFGGKILEVGANCVQKLKPGDNVAVLSDQIHIGGGLSQECVVDASICIPLKDKISVQDAVTVLRDYGNAQLAFTKYCPLEENDNIIVIAGPGGNGLAAIEIARKIYKANVFVVFYSKNLKPLLRDDLASSACDAQAGLTKVYTNLDGAMKNKKVKAVYDTTGSGNLHVVSDFVDENGHYLTDDTFFSPETCERPYFKRIKSRQKTKKTDATAPTEARAPFNNDWLQKVKIVSLAKYHNDPILFNRIVDEVCSMLAEGKIEPLISAQHPLGDVNKAVNFIQRKKCLGKVLINTTESKAK